MDKSIALPETLFADALSYAMTGTQEGATNAQMLTLAELMMGEGLSTVDMFYWHFGDCIGADQQAFDMVSDVFMFIAYTVAHPTNVEGKRAFCQATEIREPMESLGRNARMAYLGHNGLFALPRTHYEILKSGTWATVRTAAKLKRPIWIIYPDGSFTTEFESALNRQVVDRDDVELWAL